MMVLDAGSVRNDQSRHTHRNRQRSGSVKEAAGDDLSRWSWVWKEKKKKKKKKRSKKKSAREKKRRCEWSRWARRVATMIGYSRTRSSARKTAKERGCAASCFCLELTCLCFLDQLNILKPCLTQPFYDFTFADIPYGTTSCINSTYLLSTTSLARRATASPTSVSPYLMTALFQSSRIRYLDG